MPAEATGVDHAVDAFLQHASVERGLSPRTIEAYGRDLARFAALLSDAGVASVAQIERAHLVDFARALERSGLAPRSRARALVSVRRFCRHHGLLGGLGDDPLDGIRTPAFDRKLPRVLRIDETEALIAAADASTPLGLRDRSMLEMLYGGGLRALLDPEAGRQCRHSLLGQEQGDGSRQ